MLAELLAQPVQVSLVLAFSGSQDNISMAGNCLNVPVGDLSW